MLRFLIRSAFCFLSRHRLLSLFFCLFSFVTMTTDSSHCCCILSLYDVCKKAFSLNFFFFPTVTAKNQKASPVTHSCSYLLSALSSSSHVASGPKKCIFESLPTIFFSRILLCLCSNCYHPYHTHTCIQPPPAPLPLCITATEPQIMVSHS